MPSGDFPPVIEDTPPLSPSRSSVNSATRSSAASSSTNVALAGLSLRMSNMHLDGAPSHDSIDSVEQQASLPKFEPPSKSVREHGRDETNGVMQESEQEGSGQVDEPGPSEPGSRQRPVVPRQSSYSKRHSSFDSPREVPYPYGFLASSQSRAGPSKSMLLERTGSLPGSSQEAQRQRQIFREAEANSLTDGSMQEESPSPPTSEQTESTSTSSSVFGRISLSEYQEAVREIMDRYSTTEEQLAALRSSITKSGIALPPDNHKNTPSPPFSVEDPSGDSAPYRYVPSITEQRTHHHSLPPPPPPRFGSIYTPHTAPSRPSSLPHITPSGHYSSLPTSAPLPPPSPPTILTPPPDVKDPSRKPAPYEPFLPREQLPAGNTFIAVQTLSSEYQLLVRLPGFQRDSITLAVRKRRVLHIVADSWSDSGGHFERRVSFGYDADLASVRAEFDGETLKIIVPRRTLQVIPAGYGYATSHE